MGEYFTLGLNIALAVFVFFGVIFGLIRGLRKTASRGIWLVITSIILLFVTLPITNALLGIKINANFTVGETTLNGTYTISECIEYFIKTTIGEDFATQNPEFVNVITALPILFVNIIVYFVLFVACKYLLLPLNWVFYKLTFAPKRKKETFGFSASNDSGSFDELFKILDNTAEQSNSQNISNSDDSSLKTEDKNADFKSDADTESKDLKNSPAEDLDNLPENSENTDGNKSLNNNFDNLSLENLNANQNIEINEVVNENEVALENLNREDLSNNAHFDQNESVEKFEVNTLPISDEISNENEKSDALKNNLHQDNVLDNGNNLFIKNEIHVDNVNREIEKDNVKKKPKKERKKKEKIKVKKYRLWGGLVGGVVGLFVMMNVCMPIYGIMDVVRQTNKVKLSNLTDESISLSEQTNGMTDEIISAYENSIFYPVSKYLGIEGLSLAQFDLLASKTVDNKKITLRADVNNLITTASKADSLIGKYKQYVGEGSFSDLSQDELKTLLNDGEELLNYAKKVNLVDCLADYIIPFACSMILSENVKISDNSIVNSLAVDAITTLSKESGINVFDETCKLIDLAKYLNDQSLLTRILKNDFDDPIAIIGSLDSDFGSVFSNKLFSLQTVSVTAPYVLNIAFNILDDAFDFGYTNSEYSQSLDSVKSSLASFVQETINVINSIDKNSNIYITTQSLRPIGKLLQTVKVSGIVNTDTYKNLINFAIDKLQTLLDGFLPQDLESYLLDEFLENLAKVDSWEVEMDKIATAITKLRDKENGILGKVVEGEELRQGTSIELKMEESTFKNLGETLDILDETVLFGAVTTKTIDEKPHKVSGTISLFVSLIDYAETTIKNDIVDTNLHKITNVLGKLKNNLIKSDHVYTLGSEFWENELQGVSSLAIEVYDMLKAENFDITTDFGKALDKAAKGTTLFANNATVDLMITVLDIVKDAILPDGYTYNNGSDLSKPQNLNDKINELFVEVQDNLKLDETKNKVNIQSKFWETEFVYYKDLKNIAEKSTTLTSIADAKLIAGDLDNVSNSYTIPQKELFNIIAFALQDIKIKSATNDVDIAINKIIDNVSNRLQNETYFDGKNMTDFWQIEFDHISDLMDIKFEDDGDYKIIDNLTQIGKKLDNVVLGYSIKDDPSTVKDESKEIRASYLLLESDLREVLASAISNVSSSLSSSFDAQIYNYVVKALNSIKENVLDFENITNVSFQKELGAMQTLAHLKINSQMLEYPTGTESEIQLKLEKNRLDLNTLGVSLDSIAYACAIDGGAYKYTDLISESTSKNSKFIKRNIVGKLISDIFEVAKVDDSEILAKEESERTNEEKEKLAFNKLISDIQTQIQYIHSKDLTMSWQRELSFVNNLITLNGGVDYTIDNVAENVGKNLDAIAFNYVTSDGVKSFDDVRYDSLNNCIYIPQVTDTYVGNSLLITRSSIKSLMNTYLQRVKKEINAGDEEIVKEQNILVNDIVDNSVLVIAENNEYLNSGNYYNNFYSCLVELTSIKDDIDQKITDVAGGSSSISLTLAQTIDQFLFEYQTKPITGILITRRMSSLILHKMGVPTTTTGIAVLDNAINYYNDLDTYYKGKNDANNNSDSEYYYTTQSVSSTSFPNPFVTLYNKINVVSA